MSSQDEKLTDLTMEQAAEWHISHLDGGLSSQQAREFMQWLRTSPVHVAEYLAISRVAREVADAAHESTTPLAELWADTSVSIGMLRPDATERVCRLAASFPSDRRVQSRRQASVVPAGRRQVPRWLAATAVLAFVSVALLGGAHWFSAKPDIQTYATRFGEVSSLQLPDGTTAQLDTDSAIMVNFDAHNRHVVIKRGQAYLDVAKDPARPFSVRVGALLIRDIGTAFDVHRHKTHTTITVAEGRVQVWDLADPKADATRAPPESRYAGTSLGKVAADLGTGDQLQISNSGNVESLGKVDLQEALAWRTGRIIFDHQTVASVAAQFNRYNYLQINVKDRQVAALPISGMFDTHDVASFVAFLQQLPNVQVDKREQHFSVTSVAPGSDATD